jgi:hypothetical protein
LQGDQHAAQRRPDSSSLRCSRFRYGVMLGTTIGVISRSRLMISRAPSRRSAWA